MSEELLQRYTEKSGIKGHPVGPYEGFNLGSTTINQLRRHHIVPNRSYGKHGRRKPDGIVVDRRGHSPIVKFVVEFKGQHKLDSENRVRAFGEKVADEYCRPLGCEFGGISDRENNSWLLVTPDDWRFILREDDYPLDYPIDLSARSGWKLLGRTLQNLEINLNRPKGILEPVEAVNPTRLADQTWQDIWLASGEEPEECLATFIEILIFKFLSDLGVLHTNPSGIPVDLESVLAKPHGQILRYYFDTVRPEIKRLFPLGDDGTSIINGIVFDPLSEDEGRLFAQILQRFKDFGSLRKIDPEFKSRIFERFLKKSMSVKNWGQYFTPRNVVKAMVEMSGVERLPPRAVLADPACGVGGFLLEPLMHKRPHDYRASLPHPIRYVGWDRDEKTIILAKANMIVHLSEALEQDAKGAIPRLASALNATFETNRALTGSLDRVPSEEFDLVMTNPPYVTRGTGRQRDFLSEHAGYYRVGGAGIENLFTQLIINGLKPGCRGLVVVPDGLLLRHSEDNLRAYILNTCVIEAVVSLPVNTFYSTPKKTYILVIRKKQRRGDEQKEPVFTYLVSHTGETLDAKRFVISENDLPEMASLFKSFQGNPEGFSSDDPRCKVFPISKFTPEGPWLINKWWSLEEREELGDVDAETFVGSKELSTILEDASCSLTEQAEGLQAMERSAPVKRTVTLTLADKRYFHMSIGERVTHKQMREMPKGDVPLYSANVERGKEHGWIEESNIEDFTHPSILWSIDSDFNMSVRESGSLFATTDHCGRLKILDPELDPEYCKAAIIYGYGRMFGFDRVTRPSLTRMKKVTLRVPVNDDGSFDLEAQRDLSREYVAIANAVHGAETSLGVLKGLKPQAELPEDAEDLGPQPDSDPKKAFLIFAERWRKETAVLSSVARITAHPAYQQIIRLGEVSIPLILDDLAENGPDHWFSALAKVTGENPITAPMAGDLKRMTEAWLAWGNEKGYLPVSAKKTRRTSRI